MADILGTIINFLNKVGGLQPADQLSIQTQQALLNQPAPTSTPQATQPSQIPTAMPTPLPSRFSEEDVTNAITGGYRQWAGLPQQGLPDERVPMIAYAQQMAQEALNPQNPLMQRWPFLIPTLSILETSGGQNMAGENNPLNWAIKLQQQGQFSPQSFDEVINKASTGIGYRMPYYEDFRQSGNVADLARVYAPPGENNTAKYVDDFKKIYQLFESQLK